MHVVSKKDLNSPDLETMRISRIPTTVMTASGEVQTREEATEKCQRIGFNRDSKASRRYTRSSHTRKTLRRSRIFLRVDQWSETTTHQRWQTNTMQHGELRTNGCPWFIDQLFKLSYTFISNIRIAGSSTLHPASTRSESTSSTVRGDPSHEPAETKITNKNGDNETVRGKPLHDLPEWLQEFTENFVDE